MNRKHLIAHILIVGGAALAVLAVWLLQILDFFHPEWLLAFLALPFFTFMSVRSIAGLPSKTNMVSSTVRGLLFILIVIALADIQFVHRSRDLAVYFLLDYSASIPDSTREQELAYVNEAAKTKKKKDRAGIIVFAEEPSIELPPRTDLQLNSLHSTVNPNYTNMQEAIGLATAAFPAGIRKKIVVISDGNQNAGDALNAVRQATSEQVEIDVLPVAYAAAAEVLVERLSIPDKVNKNETFDLKVHVKSMQDCEGTLSLFRNEQLLAQQKVKLTAGRNHFVVPMRLKESGFFTYTARISSPSDVIQENNEASGYVYIQGNARILFVTQNGSSDEVEHLMDICREEMLEPVLKPARLFPARFEELSTYDCIVVANVPSDRFTKNQMDMVKAAVRDLGIGLIMIGGEDSFGAGGYEQTSIEDALPVSMDIRQKKVMPKGALCILLHTCEFADGNSWAKKITKAAIKTVQPRDEVGVLYYDYKDGDKWLFKGKLRPATNRQYLFSQIDKCGPGDMPSFAPAFKKARTELLKSDAMVRHIIVISDGDPAAPTMADVDALAKNNITVSCVAINPHSGRDEGVMKSIAYKTKGRYYLVKDPNKLPKIFVKEAKVVKRSLIFNKPFQPLLATSSELVKGVAQQDIPQLLAYVATTPKDRALVSIVSDNENHDPILAQWRYGLGKSVAFTSDASSNWAKHWIGWKQYRKIWSQVLRWTARKREKGDLTIRTEQDGDKVVMTVDAIDGEGNYLNFNRLNGRRVDSKLEGHGLQFHQVAPGRYQAEFNARDSGVNLVNISYGSASGKQGFVQAGISLPYSSEFLELNTNLPLLRQITREGGGHKELLDTDPAIAGVFDSKLPPSVLMQPMWEYLLFAVILLFMADVIVRRVIINAADVHAALAAANAVFRRKESTERDETMSALLRRKEKVFADKDQKEGDAPKEPAKRKPGREPGAFKSQLQQDVRDGAGAERAEIAASAEPADAPTPSQAAQPQKEPKPKPDGGGSYTDRLLEAKRRAREGKDRQ